MIIAYLSAVFLSVSAPAARRLLLDSAFKSRTDRFLQVLLNSFWPLVAVAMPTYFTILRKVPALPAVDEELERGRTAGTTPVCVHCHTPMRRSAHIDDNDVVWCCPKCGAVAGEAPDSIQGRWVY